MLSFGLAFLLASVATAGAADECTPEKLTLKGDWGKATFNVELAVTGQERSQGLMFRETMPAMAGMLFVYEQPRSVAFWMRNTLIPLDMIFTAGDGTVRRVHHQAQPLDETVIPGGDDIQYVLEINGGLSEVLGIEPGTLLQHPLIDQEIAAWPCDK